MRLTGVVSAPTPLTVVVVEDDPSIAGLMTKTLESAGHTVVACSTAADGLDAVRRAAPEVLLLDLGLPDQDGTAVLRTLRGEDHPVGIICVTARADEIDRVLGFEMGADDYVTKPFSPRELAGRVRALGRRVQREEPSGGDELTIGRVVVDTARREVRVDGTPVALTPIERDLVEYFAVESGGGAEPTPDPRGGVGARLAGREPHGRRARRPDPPQARVDGRDHDRARRGVPARMSSPNPGTRSIASRLRWSFLAVILAVTAVAAVVTIVLVRRANEDDTTEEARTTARAGARAVSVQVRSQLEGTDTNVPSLLVLIELLQRSLAIQDAEIVRIDDRGVVSLRADGADPGPRLAVTRVPTAVLESSRLSEGVPMARRVGDVVVAATPVPLGAADEETLRLEDDVVAVVAVRELGTAGLGSSGPALLIAAAVALAASILLAELLARRIRRPLEAVASTTQAISAGDLSARVELPAGANRELTDVAQTVDAMASALEESRRDRQRFLVDVSHELRTPLTSLSGYAELLADGQITGSDEVHESGVVMGREAERLRRLIDDLLTQVRLDAGEMRVRLEPVEVTAIVEGVTAALRPDAERIGIRLAADLRPVTVDADPGRLHQVIANLLDNALGFAAHRVDVSVADVDGAAVVVVADDGPGLGSAAASVFERSFTTDRPRDRQGNLGIGLSVVAGLVRAMGGTVEAADGSVGARFTVRLPASAREADRSCSKGSLG